MQLILLLHYLINHSLYTYVSVFLFFFCLLNALILISIWYNALLCIVAVIHNIYYIIATVHFFYHSRAMTSNCELSIDFKINDRRSEINFVIITEN